MTKNNLPFAIGTFTCAGVFVGMDGHLAKFDKQGQMTRCNPSIVKVLNESEYQAMLSKKAKGFWESAIVFEGEEAIKAFRSIAR
jgi:hypothetical protein